MRINSTEKVLSNRSLLIVVAYALSTFLQAPVDPEEVAGLRQVSLGQAAVSRPIALSGDSPHYLGVVTSLIEDGDLDVANNYRQAAQGKDDLGWRFRGRSIDHHTDVDRQGREISTHSNFFAGLLALAIWPAQRPDWTEPLTIWLTMAAGLGCILLVQRRLPDFRWTLVLAFATPFWCYSRDVWVEPWTALCWILLVVFRANPAVFAIGFVGTLLKYPFGVVPIAMGAWAFWKGESRRGIVLVSSGLLGMASAVAMTQWLFRDVDHFSLFHSGIHGAFNLPFDGIVGLLFGPENGLFFFFPVLLWGLIPLFRDKQAFLPMAAFFFVHAAYGDWQGGTGFSARYLVPMLPVWLEMVARADPRGVWFKVALLYSFFWGTVAGLAPGLVYDRTPWGVVLHFLEKMGWS